jgi:hypothetical protein
MRRRSQSLPVPGIARFIGIEPATSCSSRSSAAAASGRKGALIQ